MTTAQHLLRLNNGVFELYRVHKNTVVAEGDDLALVKCIPSFEGGEEYQSLHFDDLLQLTENETPIQIEMYNEKPIRIAGKVIISW